MIWIFFSESSFKFKINFYWVFIQIIIFKTKGKGGRLNSSNLQRQCQGVLQIFPTIHQYGNGNIYDGIPLLWKSVVIKQQEV